MVKKTPSFKKNNRSCKVYHTYSHTFMCISGGGEKFSLRKRGTRDLIPTRSATSERSDPTKAHLHPNTQEQHLAIRVCPADVVCGQQACSAGPATQPWHCWQPRARAGQWFRGFLHDLSPANARRDPAALSHERSANCPGAAHALLAQTALKSPPKGMF